MPDRGALRDSLALELVDVRTIDKVCSGLVMKACAQAAPGSRLVSKLCAVVMGIARLCYTSLP